jgi:hypothetical protein
MGRQLILFIRVRRKVEMQLVHDTSRNMSSGKAEIYPQSAYGIDSGLAYEVFSQTSMAVVPENNIAVLAQLVEHITRNDEVVGSTPTNGSRKKTKGYRLIRWPFLFGSLHAGLQLGQGV